MPVGGILPGLLPRLSSVTFIISGERPLKQVYCPFLVVINYRCNFREVALAALTHIFLADFYLFLTPLFEAISGIKRVRGLEVDLPLKRYQK
jgi:hypothetical protein